MHRPMDLGHGLGPTYSLHCSSFLGLPYRILLIYLVKPKKGTTMETIGRLHGSGLGVQGSGLKAWGLGFRI